MISGRPLKITELIIGGLLISHIGIPKRTVYIYIYRIHILYIQLGNLIAIYG